MRYLQQRSAPEWKVEEATRPGAEAFPCPTIPVRAMQVDGDVSYLSVCQTTRTSTHLDAFSTGGQLLAIDAIDCIRCVLVAVHALQEKMEIVSAESRGVDQAPMAWLTLRKQNRDRVECARREQSRRAGRG